jgi:RNA polymerase sigma-70 factor (ECF subfamily)
MVEIVRPISSLRVNGFRKLARDTPQKYAVAPDEELMRLSAAGDTCAFEEIVVRHGPFALRVAARMLSDQPLAQDVVQEAMVRAWTHADRFDPRRAQFTTWLYRIVVNMCIDHRRRVHPEHMQEGFDPVDPAAEADDMIEAAQRQRLLAQALNDLSARERAAMTLVYEEDLSGAEAARVLGVTAKAVERLLARARARLRERLLRA